VTSLALDGAAARALLDAPGVGRIMALINAEGGEGRIVGGAVRNALIGRPITDIDFATTLTPDAVAARAKAAGVKAIPTGVEHGTLTLVAGGAAFEVTTLRRDVATDGRRAVVAFTTDFAIDAARRDFTINQLMLDAGGQIHDSAGGLDDLAARRVRFIGDPDQRIIEDYLRILRFFRFSAEYGAGALDAHGLAACARHKAGLGKLSRERIWTEVKKLIAAPRAVEILASLTDRAIWAEIIDRPADLATLAAALAIWPEADAMTRLAAFSVRRGDDPAAFEVAFRTSGAERARLEAAAAARQTLMAAPALTAQAMRVAAFRHGGEGARDGLATFAVRLNHAEARSCADQPAPRSPWRGADLLAAGMERGPHVGAVLAEAHRLWELADFPASPEAQARILNDARRMVEAAVDRPG
jgi:poly(A) polymerase